MRIFSRLLLSYIGVVLLATFIVSFAITYLTSNFYKRHKEEELSDLARALAFEYSLIKREKGEMEALKFLNEMSQSTHYHICIVPPRATHLAQEIREKGIRWGPICVVPYSAVSAGAEIRERGKVIGTLVVHSSIDEVIYLVRYLQRVVLSSAIIALLFSFLLAVLLSNSLASPLREMQMVVNKWKEGELGARMCRRAKGEIEDLRLAFNTLAEKLEESIRNLQDEKERLSAFFSVIPEGIIAIKEGEEPLLNSRAEELFSSGIPSEIAEVLEKGKEGECRKEIRWGDRIFLVASAPLARGRGAVALVQDVTEIRQLERVRRDFLTDVSHELRTPLTAIRGYTEAIMDGTVEEKEARKYLSRILEETLYISRFVDDLLQLARAETGKLEVQRKKVDLGKIARKAGERLKIMAKEKDVAIEIAKKFPFAFCDEGLTERVLFNLLENAIKFNRPGGKVVVSYRIRDEEVEVSVRDEGEGIPSKDLPYIFERFYKADRARVKGSGIGLGLAIVKSLVELQGGRVWVESEEGKGSTFYFTLPLYKEGIRG